MKRLTGIFILLFLAGGGFAKNVDFYLTDHLGNNRAVVAQDGTVEQSTEYYPYGLPFDYGTGKVAQPYKFGGKEFDPVHGLDLYDFSAREMDPGLGRFTTMDPLAEKDYSGSPYAYAGNDPVNLIDPDGMQVISTIYTTPGGVHLLDTDDGRDDVFIVPYNRIGEFLLNASWTNRARPNGTDDTGWNNYWRGEFKMGFSEAYIYGLGYNGLHGADSKRKWIKYLLSGKPSDLLAANWRRSNRA